MPRFLIYHPSEGSRVFELFGGRPIAIGRAKSSNLVLDNASISRLHAVVRATPQGQWEIIDRASANGMKVNGMPQKEAVLQANDEIILGEYRLRYFEDSSSREMVTYGTPELPPRLARVMSEPAYSGSFLPVVPVAGTNPPVIERTVSAEERLRALERENKLLTVLYHVNRALAEMTSVHEVTQRILDLVLEMEGAERAFVMLLDKESIGQTSFSGGGYGFEPALIRYRSTTKAPASGGTPQLTISQSIIRQVMHGGLPLLVSDPQADPRLAASKSILASGLQSAMCAPLAVKDRSLGLLYVDNFSHHGMFTVEDLNVFAMIASQAGLAIDRARARSDAPQQVQETISATD